jgi:hypothetical protein
MYCFTAGIHFDVFFQAGLHFAATCTVLSAWTKGEGIGPVICRRRVLIFVAGHVQNSYICKLWIHIPPTGQPTEMGIWCKRFEVALTLLRGKIKSEYHVYIWTLNNNMYCFQAGLHFAVCFQAGLHFAVCFQAGLHFAVCLQGGPQFAVCFQAGPHFAVCFQAGLHFAVCFHVECVAELLT